jgi:hypothetical protein
VDNPQPYCLDSNVLIQAWLEYYSPKICPSYWDVLNRLGQAKRIFIPQAVFDEIAKTEDELSKWLKKSDIEVHKADGNIGEQLTRIYASDLSHQHLVDNRKGRSLADPWVIAHALMTNACVVTKENIILQGGKDKIKIPNVCQNMNVRCINDFEFVKELGIQFTCESLLY